MFVGNTLTTKKNHCLLYRNVENTFLEKTKLMPDPVVAPGFLTAPMCTCVPIVSPGTKVPMYAYINHHYCYDAIVSSRDSYHVTRYNSALPCYNRAPGTVLAALSRSREQKTSRGVHVTRVVTRAENHSVRTLSAVISRLHIRRQSCVV